MKIICPNYYFAVTVNNQILLYPLLPEFKLIPHPLFSQHKKDSCFLFFPLIFHKNNFKKNWHSHHPPPRKKNSFLIKINICGFPANDGYIDVKSSGQSVYEMIGKTKISVEFVRLNSDQRKSEKKKISTKLRIFTCRTRICNKKEGGGI